MTALKYSKFALLALALLALAACRQITRQAPVIPGSATVAAEAPTTPLTNTLFIPAIGPGGMEQTEQAAPARAASCNDVIRNGAFDATSAGRPWTGVVNTSSRVYAPSFLNNVRAHSGSQSGRVGSPALNGVWDELLQTVQLPAGVTSVTLTYWRFLDTTETSTTKAYDIFSAGLETEKGIQIVTPQRIDNTSAGRGQWVKSTLTLADPAAYSSQRLWVTFKGRTDNNLPSSLYVDDVQLTVCATGW
ncbi:MAG TPA: hypothetical protein VGK81_12645 [Anaerolineae bacterium]